MLLMGGDLAKPPHAIGGCQEHTPSVLTAALVKRPAKISVRPKARMKGHAVGAGDSIVVGSPERRPTPSLAAGSSPSLTCSLGIFNHPLRSESSVKTAVPKCEDCSQMLSQGYSESFLQQ